MISPWITVPTVISVIPGYRGAAIASKLAPTLVLRHSQDPCGSGLARDGVRSGTLNSADTPDSPESL
ncbi:hypothetical protein EI969_28885 [Pseudomonas sp. PB101]|nr:hypothetical protein [Pseudomonas sp. PB101]